MTRADRKSPSRQAGFSLLEMMIATFIGLLALFGILFIYKTQNKGVVTQGAISEMRLNGQFALNEILYYLAPAGLGLPDAMRAVVDSSGDLMVRTNSSKKSSLATFDATYLTSGKVRYALNVPGDTGNFKKKVYAAVLNSDGVPVEVPIYYVTPRNTTTLTPAYVAFVGDKTLFPATTTIYPMEKTAIHRCTGVGADTVEGYFRVVAQDPQLRTPDVTGLDTLTLAEGIDSIGFKYYMANGDSLGAVPADLANLQRVGVVVRAKTLIKDPTYPGDGYHRQTLNAKVNYRRSL